EDFHRPRCHEPGPKHGAERATSVRFQGARRDTADDRSLAGWHRAHAEPAGEYTGAAGLDGDDRGRQAHTLMAPRIRVAVLAGGRSSERAPRPVSPGGRSRLRARAPGKLHEAAR